MPFTFPGTQIKATTVFCEFSALSFSFNFPRDSMKMSIPFHEIHTCCKENRKVSGQGQMTGKGKRNTAEILSSFPDKACA